MAVFEFLALIVFIDWCGTRPPHWQPPSIPKDVDPTKEFQGWMTKPWVAQAITQFHYLLLTGLILLVIVTHREETFNLKYGPFILVPGFRIFVGMLPRYKPYGGVWDKLKEGAERTPIPAVVDRVKEKTSGNPLSGILGTEN